jgi:hypothetical protein
MRSILHLLLFCPILHVQAQKYQFLKVDPKQRIETLVVVLQADTTIAPLMANVLQARATEMLYKLNARSKKVYFTEDTSLSATRIVTTLRQVRLATPKQQNTAFAVTMFGAVAIPTLLVLAEAPILFGFWSTARNQALFTTELTPDLRGRTYVHRAQSLAKTPGGWFRKDERNCDQVAKDLVQQVKRNIRKVERSQAKFRK